MQTGQLVFTQVLGTKVEMSDLIGHGAILVFVFCINLCLMYYKDPHYKTEDFICPAREFLNISAFNWLGLT